MRARRTPVFLLALLWAGPAPAGLSINEILYDPPGPDGGAEYVELYCAGASPCVLEGRSLHFVNGSDPDRAREIFRFGPRPPLPPGAFLVLGGSLVEPRDIELGLGLQNGPDALRLEGDGGVVLDAVAWGESAPGGEGAPAPDASGLSIGRVPDGQDRDDNSVDFVVLPAPSPGRPNARAVDFRLLGWRLQPAWSPRPGPATLGLTLLAVGFAPWQQATLVGWGGGTVALAAARGDSLEVELALELAAGVQQELGLAVLAGTDTLLATAIPLAVGPGDIVLNEIMPRPDRGASEWFELHNRSGALRSLVGWAVADADGGPRELGEHEIAGGGYLVFASDPAGVAGATGPVLRPQGGWPSLNNGDREEIGAADWLRLYDAAGRCVDGFAWTAAQLERAGRALERTRVGPRSPSSWVVAPGAPSPGAANAAAVVPLPGGPGLALHPQPVRFAAGEVLHVRLLTPAPGEYRAWVVDLAGEAVRELGVLPSDGLAHWTWSGEDQGGRRVPAGAYVLLAGGAGDALPGWRSLLVVGVGR